MMLKAEPTTTITEVVFNESATAKERRILDRAAIRQRRKLMFRVQMVAAPVKPITLSRTPEEWKEIVVKARKNTEHLNSYFYHV